MYLLVGDALSLSLMVQPKDSWLSGQIKYLLIDKENIDFEHENNPNVLVLLFVHGYIQLFSYF